MNFLQLVQFAHRQIGSGGEFVGTTPLDVTVPFGPLAELAASVNDAYKDIQAEQNLWRFRTMQGTYIIPNGVRTVAKTVLHLSPACSEKSKKQILKWSIAMSSILTNTRGIRSRRRLGEHP